jgi:hypothetical protein
MSSTSLTVPLPRQEYPSYLQNKQSKEEAAKNSLDKNIQGTIRPRNDFFNRYIDNGGGRVKRRMVRLARGQGNRMFVFSIPGSKTGVSSWAPQLPDNGGCVLATTA